MKQNHKSKFATSGIAVLSVAVLLWAGLQVTSFNAPVNPASSQADIQKQLATTRNQKQSAVAAIPKATPPSSQQQPSSVSAALPTTLVNTGPGNIVTIIIGAIAIGYAGRLYRLRLLCSHALANNNFGNDE